MKCRYCGKEIPEGALYCKACGREVFIVPEYNPLDDMLTEQIRDSIDGTGREEDYLVYDDASFQTRATQKYGPDNKNGKYRTDGQYRTNKKYRTGGASYKRTKKTSSRAKKTAASKKTKKNVVDHGTDSGCNRGNQRCALSKFLYGNCG